MTREMERPVKGVALLIGVALWSTACQSLPTPSFDATEPTASYTLATEFPTKTKTPTLTPIPTLTPFPSPTPGPEIDFNEPHPTISYTIPLTSQRLTETSAILYFALDQKTEGYLFYGPASSDALRYVEHLDEGETAHIVVINNLEAGRSYKAAVGLFADDRYKTPMMDGELWDPIQFRTPEEDGTSVRIGVIGDSGFGEQVTYNLAEQMADIGLDFVIHTGDVVYKVEENANPVEAFKEKYYLPFSGLLHHMPLLAVPGNHEYDAAAEMAQVPYYYFAFPHVPGWTPQTELNLRQYYSYEVGIIQFLFLDSQAFWRTQGVEEQTHWLEERLKDQRFKVSIPVLHVPPFSSGLHSTDGVLIERNWVSLFQEYNVPLVLSGHDHNYQRLIVGGTTYVVSGGGSSVIYPMDDPHPAGVSFSAESHFLLLILYPNSLELNAISNDGVIIDEAVIEIGDDIQ